MTQTDARVVFLPRPLHDPGQQRVAQLFGRWRASPMRVRTRARYVSSAGRPSPSPAPRWRVGTALRHPSRTRAKLMLVCVFAARSLGLLLSGLFLCRCMDGPVLHMHRVCRVVASFMRRGISRWGTEAETPLSMRDRWSKQRRHAAPMLSKHAPNCVETP